MNVLLRFFFGAKFVKLQRSTIRGKRGDLRGHITTLKLLTFWTQPGEIIC